VTEPEDEPLRISTARLYSHVLIVHMENIGGGTIRIPRSYVMHIRDLCNAWIRRHGAFDTQGRRVLQSTEPGPPNPEGAAPLSDAQHGIERPTERG
jgi:hypothetical protein